MFDNIKYFIKKRINLFFFQTTRFKKNRKKRGHVSAGHGRVGKFLLVQRKKKYFYENGQNIDFFFSTQKKENTENILEVVVMLVVNIIIELILINSNFFLQFYLNFELKI